MVSFASILVPTFAKKSNCEDSNHCDLLQVSRAGGAIELYAKTLWQPCPVSWIRTLVGAWEAPELVLITLVKPCLFH